MGRVLTFLAAALLLLAGCVPVSRAESLAEEQASLDVQAITAQTGLWIDMSMAPQLIDWYNGVARPDDVARADHVSLVDLLDRVEVGKRLVVFKNVADAEELLPHLAQKLDIIGYNLEHGPTNRPDEQADPVGSVRRMRDLADEYGKVLALGPDRAFALSDGVAMAPYVDIFTLQVQRAQTEPDVVRAFVVPLVQELRQANPDLQITVQVRTEGDVVAIADLVGSMESSLDGVSILTSEETIDIAKALVAELRPSLPEPAAGAPEAPLGAQPEPAQATPALHAAVIPTINPSPRKNTPAPAPALVVTPAGGEEAQEMPTWLALVALASMGIVISALLATMWVHTLQNSRRR